LEAAYTTMPDYHCIKTVEPSLPATGYRGLDVKDLGGVSTLRVGADGKLVINGTKRVPWKLTKALGAAEEDEADAEPETATYEHATIAGVAKKWRRKHRAWQ
jgi:hypothetical protein